MNTADLIDSLAAQPPRPALLLPRLGAAIVAAVVLAAGLFLSLIHISEPTRPY